MFELGLCLRKVNKEVWDFISSQIPPVLTTAKTAEKNEFVLFTGISVPPKAVVCPTGVSVAIAQEGLQVWVTAVFWISIVRLPSSTHITFILVRPLDRVSAMCQALGRH